MSLIHISIEAIEIADLNELKDNGVPESLTLEYKASLKHNKDSEKKELLYDISAFANTQGGEIIFGVKEKRDEAGKSTGLIDTICGIKNLNFDDTVKKIENLVRDGIEPRLNRLDWKEIKIGTESSVIILRVERSLNSPHMVKISGDQGFYTRFYARNNAGKNPMSYDEIKQSFLNSGGLIQDALNWQNQRFDNNYVNIPYNLISPTFLALNFIPLGNRNDLSEDACEKAFINSSEFRPISTTAAGGNNDGPTLEGIIRYTFPKYDSLEIYGFVLLHRTGHIEIVDTDFFGSIIDFRKGKLDLAYLGKFFDGTLSNIIEGMKRIDLRPPYLLTLNFINAIDHEFFERGKYRYGPVKKIKSNRLTLKPMLIQDWNLSIEEIKDYFIKQVRNYFGHW